MQGFKITTKDNKIIRFRYYNEEAPVTVEAFSQVLPFTRTFLHARVSGQEIWIDNAPELDIIQENASVVVYPGEVAIGTVLPKRNKVSKCMAVLYGEGSFIDCSNIFAIVYEEDMPILKQLGDDIWKRGSQELTFSDLN